MNYPGPEPVNLWMSAAIALVGAALVAPALGRLFRRWWK